MKHGSISVAKETPRTTYHTSRPKEEGEPRLALLA